MIRIVRLSLEVARQISRGAIPKQTVQKLLAWRDDVAELGLAEVRKRPGFHDEPLKGDRRGQRSIRLNKTWRAIYEIHDGAAQFVLVEEVTPHKY